MRSISFLLILLFCTLTGASAGVGPWSTPLPIDNVAHLPLVYQWRLFATDAEHEQGMIEWVFLNQSTLPVTFSYRIVTETNDSFTGRITLPPGARRVAGWFFRGSRIAEVLSTDLVVGSHE